MPIASSTGSLHPRRRKNSHSHQSLVLFTWETWRTFCRQTEFQRMNFVSIHQPIIIFIFFFLNEI